MSCDACKRLTVEELHRRPCGYCRREAPKGADMSTRTFILDEIRAAWRTHETAYNWKQFEVLLLAAKPEAKTCEDCGGLGLVNPTPAASPPAWLPLGQHPGGRCESLCGAWRNGGIVHCSMYCRDRAKAVPRDGAKDSVPGALRPSVDEKPNPVPTERVTEEPRAGLAKGAVSESVGTGGGQPGVPDGFRLGGGWRTLTRPGPCSWHTGKVCAEMGHITNNGHFGAVCLAHAKQAGAIVPIEPSRPVTGEAVDIMGALKAALDKKFAGTAAHDPRCCAKCHHAAHVNPCQHGCACTLSSPSGTTYVAPGKPDEAPLTCKQCDVLEGQLSDARRCRKSETANRDATIDRLSRELSETHAKVVTRDARIAGLEASSADLVKRCQEAERRLDAARGNTVAEVMLERERCAALAKRWLGSAYHDGHSLYEGISSGAPAPTGKP